MSAFEFSGKTVLVTGAASGLGRAASLRFAAEGANLCAVDVNAEGLAETERRIVEGGGMCVSRCTDLGTPTNCAGAVSAAIDAFGRLDVLCNVAGILRFHALDDVGENDWAKLFAVNVTAPFFMIKAAMPHLVESGGNVVNVVSTAAFLGQAYTAPYAATKAALLSLTRSLAMEFIKSPVRINAIAPGGMPRKTSQAQPAPPSDTNRRLSRLLKGWHMPAGLRPIIAVRPLSESGFSCPPVTQWTPKCPKGIVANLFQSPLCRKPGGRRMALSA